MHIIFRNLALVSTSPSNSTSPSESRPPVEPPSDVTGPTDPITPSFTDGIDPTDDIGSNQVGYSASSIVRNDLESVDYSVGDVMEDTTMFKVTQIDVHNTVDIKYLGKNGSIEEISLKNPFEITDYTRPVEVFICSRSILEVSNGNVVKLLEGCQESQL